MNTKKKILITTGIGTAAVVAGVAPAIASTVSSQSTIVDGVTPTTPEVPTNPDQSSNPENPSVENPVDAASLATIPANDEFTYSIEHFNVLPDVLLDQYLQKLFMETNFFEEYKDSFKNSSEYSNVTVTYVKDSVNEVNKTFELLATPVEGTTWSNKTNDSKVITVNLKNIENLDAETPDSDTIVFYNKKIDGTFFANNNDLNKHLYELFLEDQTENFSVPEGSLNFKNVNINYFLQTADLKNRTFKISVSPKDKHNWTESLKNKYGNSVILTVKMTNFIAQNDAEAPKVNSTVSYNKEIDGTYFKNNGDLNNYLKQLFSTDQSANLVDSEGNSAFKNVRVIYYEQSANLQNRSFKIYVYPKDGHTWVDSQSRNSYMLEVKISNFVIHDIKDSLTPKRSITFTSTIIGNMKTDAEFNNYLTNLFKTNQQSNLLPAVTDYKFKNVSISYVANSANLSAKSFAVNVAPSQGHAWADGSKNTITLTAICTNFVNKEKLLVTPQAFNSDIIINTQFDWSIGYYLNWSNINKFLNPNFTIGRFITNREGWYNEALNYQKALAEQSFKSFSKYNPNLEMVSYQLGNISNDEFRGLVTRYTINTEVKPKAGYFWQDGTNGSKWVPISFFSANIWNGSAWIGQTNNISDANKLIDENWNGSVPTKTWVSNKIFNTAEFDKLIKYGATNRKLNFGECRELIIKHAKAELEATFTNYYVIKMSEPEPTRSGDIYAPWKFRVTLAKTLGGADKVEFDGIVLVAK